MIKKQLKNEFLRPIPPGRIPYVLFMGNGLNRAFNGASWDKALEKLSTGEYDNNEELLREIKKLPYSLQTVIISSDSVSEGMTLIADSMLPEKLSKEHADILGGYTSLGFDAILTTNYSFEIERSIKEDFHISKGKPSKYRISQKEGSKAQEQFGIFKYYYVDGHNIWHIHGDAAHPKSMVMGHYYYGKLLAEIQKRVPDIIRSYKVSQSKGIPYLPQSWIDYFLLGNIYIVGFGLDPSEMDIWWLINCKKRHFSNCGKMYFYEPNLDNPSKYPVRTLAEIFDIDYELYHVTNDLGYRDFYKQTRDNLSREINHGISIKQE